MKNLTLLDTLHAITIIIIISSSSSSSSSSIVCAQSYNCMYIDWCVL